MNIALTMLNCRRFILNTLSKSYRGIIRNSSSLPEQSVIDFREPAVQKYLETIRTGCRLGTAPKHLFPLGATLEERHILLDSIKNLDELHKENDDDMRKLVDEEKVSYENDLKLLNEKILNQLVPEELSYGYSECIIEVIAGVGGQEAMLFARELMEMYQGYAAYRGWSSEINHEDLTDTGGVRHTSALIVGPGAYETLIYEGGVHRVQRIPATEKSGRLHTSTVSVAIMKQPSEIEVEINVRDLRIDTKRASGAGGQHVNTTDSCVRIVHLPTGITVECQVERDQHRNRRLAMTRLRALLYKQKQEAQMQKEKDNKKSQIGSSFRNEKIRTYNFNQDRVTDHRLASNSTVHDLNGVLKGGSSLHSIVVRLQKADCLRKLQEEIEALRLDLNSRAKKSK